VPLPIGGTPRYVAIEDAARYRDALGIPLPQGIPQALRAPVADPAGDLISRFARTHGPFQPADPARRFTMPEPIVRGTLAALVGRGRVLEGEFRPGGSSREYIDANVLRQLRRRSLARLRKEVEAVEPSALGRFSVAWHAIGGRRSGPDALLDVIDQLQGAPLPASIFEYEILGARLGHYSPEWLDTLAAAGEIRWVGLEPLGQRDGRIALYLTDQLRALVPPPSKDELAAEDRAILNWLKTHGASFFDAIHGAAGGGFPGDTVTAIWNLVWRGAITNDTFFALRAFTARPDTRRRARPAPAFRSRRLVPPAAEGRWTLVHGGEPMGATERMTSGARQLLARYGVLTREALVGEGLKGGFSGIYPVLRALDDAGRVRRGYFVAGLGATQFALPGALDLLRSLREPAEHPQTAVLAATDPANPYGVSLPWPIPNLARVVGATVVLVDGEMTTYLARGNRDLSMHLPPDEPYRTRRARAAAARLGGFARGDARGRRALMIATIDDQPAFDHPFAAFLEDAGFLRGGMGLHFPRPPAGANQPDAVIELDADEIEEPATSGSAGSGNA
ncbi:MAG TPA: hypothetical protein VFO19_23770, partial [Vicinamibacterales bacterium]|nr:hypothetical protein [Vicinamibacterales bacterium]